MGKAANEDNSLEKVSENLVNFSVDRDDLNRIMAMLPEDENVNRVTVEYEIPLLKIVSVGWAIAYFMEDRPEKKPCRNLSGRLSTNFHKVFPTSPTLQPGLKSTTST